MSRKQLTPQQKYKYVKIAKEKDIETSIVTYPCDNEDRYEGWYLKNSKERRRTNLQEMPNLWY